jgi:PIN domain nuclease of toxin-antitoxin system
VTEGLLLDTHVWIWFFAESRRIPTHVTLAIREAAEQDILYIAAYTLFEVMYAAQRNRLEIDLPLDQLLPSLLEEPSVRILPLTPSIALASANLPPSFGGDPGDRLIAATAITHNLTLCTHDGHLLRFGRQGIYKFLEV